MVRYVYNGSQVTQVNVTDTNDASINFTLRIGYDALGTPLTVNFNGTTYFYATNLQGDVIAILDAEGNAVVTYSYDAWGNPTGGTRSSTDPNANALYQYNPLRYRGYIYDFETGLYYLQSRYYNPQTGRFLNADGYVSTGQGFIGNNMFAYCFNNPINMLDYSGYRPKWVDDIADWVNGNIIEPGEKFIEDIAEDWRNYDSDNESEEKVLESNYFSSYKGVPVFRYNGDRSGSFGVIFLTRETNTRSDAEDVVRHEYGHTKQLEQLGVINYALCIGLPSWQQWGTGEYYSKPWEITADIYGGVQSREHSQINIDNGSAYLCGSIFLGPLIWVFIE